jgi:hypothetical protein
MAADPTSSYGVCAQAFFRSAVAQEGVPGLARSTSTVIRQPTEACDCSPRKIAAGAGSKFARVAT